MNTKHLEYILEVYRCGSINRAAKRCYISQSYLSKIIRDMEVEIGFSIMDRSPSGLSLTSAGTLFIASAQRIVDECDLIYRIPARLSNAQTLNIVCSPDSFLSHGFFDFEKEFPIDQASDALKESGLREILQRVISGESQLGIMAMFEQKREKYAMLAEKYDLELAPLKTHIPLIAVMNKRHPLAGQNCISVEDFSRYPYAVDANVDYDDTLGILNIQANQSVLYVSGLSCMLDALKKNNYITIELETMRSYIIENGLCSRSICDLNEHAGIYALRSTKQPPSEREQKFINFLKTRLDKEYPDHSR